MTNKPYHRKQLVNCESCEKEISAFSLKCTNCNKTRSPLDWFDTNQLKALGLIIISLILGSFLTILFFTTLPYGVYWLWRATSPDNNGEVISPNHLNKDIKESLDKFIKNNKSLQGNPKKKKIIYAVAAFSLILIAVGIIWDNSGVRVKDINSIHSIPSSIPAKISASINCDNIRNVLYNLDSGLVFSRITRDSNGAFKNSIDYNARCHSETSGGANEGFCDNLKDNISTVKITPERIIKTTTSYDDNDEFTSCKTIRNAPLEFSKIVTGDSYTEGDCGKYPSKRTKSKFLVCDRAAAEIIRTDDPLYVDPKPAKKPVVNTTYKAILTCGFNGMHTNILACFDGTDLKLTNNGQTGIYKIYNISQLGDERRDGFHITLSNSFNLTAQNSHDTLTLGIKVYDNNNSEVYQDMVGMWGVIKISN